MVAQALTSPAHLIEVSAQEQQQQIIESANEQRLSGYFDHLLDQASPASDAIYQQLDEKLAQIGEKVEQRLADAPWREQDSVIKQQRMVVVGEAGSQAAQLQYLLDLIQIARSLPNSKLKQVVLMQCQSLLQAVS